MIRMYLYLHIMICICRQRCLIKTLDTMSDMSENPCRSKLPLRFSQTRHIPEAKQRTSDEKVWQLQ